MMEAIPPEPTILVRYDEIFLKGRNQGEFLRCLKNNIARQVGLRKGQVRITRGRLFVEPEGRPASEILGGLRRVFGISSASEARRTSKDYDAMACAAVALAAEAVDGGASTFKVAARRSDKTFPIDSRTLNERLGAAVLTAVPGLRVDVHRPDLVLGVEVRRDATYLHGTRHEGPGGIPCGMAGRALCLLSSGIDSPVAAFMTQRRGTLVDALYFHSFPFTGNQVQEKVLDQARILSGWRPGPMKVLVASATPFQKALKESVREPFWTISLRRFMMRVADRLAEAGGYQAVVTGEAVGQVASQTLENLSHSNAACSTLVLRPLSGFDKKDVIALARRIGTYEVSIRPGVDCCTVFQPRSPKTRPSRDAVLEAESGLDMASLVDEAVATIEAWRVTPAGVLSVKQAGAS